jgi:hypothetical protein
MGGRYSECQFRLKILVSSITTFDHRLEFVSIITPETFKQLRWASRVCNLYQPPGRERMIQILNDLRSSFKIQQDSTT